MITLDVVWITNWKETKKKRHFHIFLDKSQKNQVIFSSQRYLSIYDSALYIVETP